MTVRSVCHVAVPQERLLKSIPEPERRLSCAESTRRSRRCSLWDGAKVQSKAIRATFCKTVAIQRCQIHKARKTMSCLPKALHPSTRRVLGLAWEFDDAAENLIRNLAPARHTQREAAKRQDGPERGRRRHDRGGRGAPQVKAHRPLPILRAALLTHQQHLAEKRVAHASRTEQPATLATQPSFNKLRDIPAE